MVEVALPEYRRIRDALRAQLESGELSAGDRIPTERELVSRFGVAHMTVRHAVDGLVREGLLVRRRGSGTYVAQNSEIRRSMNKLQSFSDDVNGKKAGASVVLQVETDPSDDVALLLEMPTPGRVVELLRVRSVDGKAAAIHQVWVPVRIASGLVSEDMTDRSLYAYFAGIGVELDRAEQRVFAAAAETWHADLLGVPVGSPLLASERVSRDVRNVPVELARTWSTPELSVWTEMRR